MLLIYYSDQCQSRQILSINYKRRKNKDIAQRLWRLDYIDSLVIHLGIIIQKKKKKSMWPFLKTKEFL